MRRLAAGACGLLLVCATGLAYADEVFLSEPQLAVALFGAGAVGAPAQLTLTDAELATVSKKLDKRVEVRTYSYVAVTDTASEPLGVVLEVEVVGQSQPIRFAVAVRPDGTLRDLEVMVYREPHGVEIRERRFRAQFAGKSERDPLLVGKDIDALSGATTPRTPWPRPFFADSQVRLCRLG